MNDIPATTIYGAGYAITHVTFMLIGSSQKGQLQVCKSRITNGLMRSEMNHKMSVMLARHLPNMEENEVRFDAQLCIHCSKQLL